MAYRAQIDQLRKSHRVPFMEPFSQQEEKTFAKAMYEHPKNFHRMRRLFPGRTTRDLVHYFYKTFKTLPVYKVGESSSGVCALSSLSASLLTFPLRHFVACLMLCRCGGAGTRRT